VSRRANAYLYTFSAAVKQLIWKQKHLQVHAYSEQTPELVYGVEPASVAATDPDRTDLPVAAPSMGNKALDPWVLMQMLSAHAGRSSRWKDQHRFISLKSPGKRPTGTSVSTVAVQAYNVRPEGWHLGKDLICRQFQRPRSPQKGCYEDEPLYSAGWVVCGDYQARGLAQILKPLDLNSNAKSAEHSLAKTSSIATGKL